MIDTMVHRGFADWFTKRIRNEDWHMVIQVKPRDVYDMGDENLDATTETVQLVAPNNSNYLIPEGDEPVPTVRGREDGDEWKFYCIYK